MTDLLDPRQFYEASLAKNGIEIRDEEAEIQKVAEKLDKPIELVKLARAYYEQLQKDEVHYKDDNARSADAFKLAEQYFDYAENQEKTAQSRANALLDALAKTAEKWAEEMGIECPDPLELVKTAGLQAQSTQHVLYLEKLAEEQLKAAEAVNTIPAEIAKVASPEDPSLGKPQAGMLKLSMENLHFGEKTPANLNVPVARHAVADMFAQKHGLNINDPATLQQVHQHIDSNLLAGHSPAQQNTVLHNMAINHSAGWDAAQQAHKSVNTGMLAHLKRYKYPYAIAGAAAVGLGGAYMLRKHREKKQQDAQAQLTSQFPSLQPPAAA